MEQHAALVLGQDHIKLPTSGLVSPGSSITVQFFVMVSGEASVPEDFDSEDDLSVPIPFRPRAPKACRRKGRLLANPLFQHPDPEMISVQGWLSIHQ